GAAFEALYRRHEGRLFRFVRRVLGAALAAQADEVFQDTWMKIIQARVRFEPGQARWTTWAFAIAHNTCLDQLRKSGREVSQHELAGGNNEDDNDDTVLDWLQTRLGDNSPSSEDSAHWRAAGQQLMHCLQQLPDTQRAAFLLHHEDDCSLQEMAAALQIALEAAKSRLRYAMTKLRGCMGAYLEDWPLAGGRT
nr:sigma-70 family RNA polymerase sigma factor [Rhodoferax sp.]